MNSPIDQLTLDLLLGVHNPNRKILNPVTGGLSFGRIPKNRSGIPEGEVHLRVGKIGFGKDKKGAYGARHIWDKHRVDLKITKPENLTTILLKIFMDGAEILVDPNKNIDPYRPLILSRKYGMGIVERRGKDLAAYNVISAYSKTAVPGILIGKFEGA